MNIAIIGCGFSGLAACWHLLHLPSSFPKPNIHLFDCKEIGLGTSAMAAGLLHPFVGAHAKLNWRGKEAMMATEELLSIASETLGRSVIAKEKGILRLALSDEQKNDFRLCVEKYPEETNWLDSNECNFLAPGCAKAPGLWIKQGMAVYSHLYLKGLFLACQRANAHFEKREIRSLSELEHFDVTIVTAGWESGRFPECAPYRLNSIKGQVLEFAWDSNLPPLLCPLNSHAYLVMTESKTSCLVGATYEKGFTEAKPDLASAQKEILPKAFELFPPLRDLTLINCYAGMRAATPQHLPLLERLSPKQWVLTGMGSKGLLYHALFAKELAEKIRSLA